MSDKSLRLSISVVEIATLVTRVVPAAQVDYILLASAAYMDTSGRYRYIQENTVVADTVAFGVSKLLSDSINTPTDDQVFTVNKGLSDSIGFTDSVITVLVFLRDFTETLSATDATALLVSPAYVESVISSDTIAFSHSKAFADGFAMNDMADAGGPVWSFSDTTANIVTMSDSSLLSNDKGASDSVSAADSGVLSMQDYCDLTYFAEDYVGTSRTF